MERFSIRTQVAIIGGGPAGMLLAHLLARSGIESIVIERQTRDHVRQRIRAGVLEAGSVALLRDAGLGQRMDREGVPHDGSAIAWAGRSRFFIDTKKYTGKQMTAYGQTAITEDLYAASDAAGRAVLHTVSDVRLHDLDSAHPAVTFEYDGAPSRIDCDYIAGCDGFHGVSRHAIPAELQRTFERAYPFGWLGIMSRTPPYRDVSYVSQHRGFALASMRNAMLSRYYIQCTLDATVDEWPDERFWHELKARCPTDMANEIVTGPSIEKSIAPLRSFVCEPMQYGTLFLVGDAAHIVPPTGAKDSISQFPTRTTSGAASRNAMRAEQRATSTRIPKRRSGACGMPHGSRGPSRICYIAFPAMRRSKNARRKASSTISRARNARNNRWPNNMSACRISV